MGTATDAELAGFERLLNAVLEEPEVVESMVRENPELLECINNSSETVFHWLVIENSVDEMVLLHKLGAAIPQFAALHALQAGAIEALDFVLTQGSTFGPFDPHVAMRNPALNLSADHIERLTVRLRMYGY